MARVALIARPCGRTGLKLGLALFDALSMKLEQSSIRDVGDIHHGATVAPEA
jgi:hypothetical protein